MLSKILFKNQSKSQLIIAIIGAFLGFSFLLTSLHYLIRVNEFGEGDDTMKNNTIIIQRKVSNYTTLGMSKTGFDDRDIANYKNEAFIDNVYPILSNSFDVSLTLKEEKLFGPNKLRTDVFVQSVETQFLDIDTLQWKWNEEDEFVPVIIPREWLLMANNFVAGQGIPQISDEIASELPITLTISNTNGKENRKAKIVGFTNIIGSILVPKSFVAYGNNKYPQENKGEISNLIIAVKDGEFGKFEAFMEKKHIEPKASSLAIGKLKSVASTLFSIILSVSILTIFLSLLVLIQYGQLILSKNQYEITTLLRIGYPPKTINKTFSIYFVKVFAVIVLSSVTLFLMGKYFIDTALKSGGIFIETALTWQSFLLVLAVFLLYLTFNKLSAKKIIYKSK
ncbi:MAG: FtsX-like permease family protein [Lishizhenia sp.]